MLVVDDGGHGWAQGLFAQVPVGTPFELLIGEVSELGHRGNAQIAGLRENRSIQMR